MAIGKVDSVQAVQMCSEGAIYLDVRSVPEFEAGHPPGAYNIPLLHMSDVGMEPNPNFAEEAVHTLAKHHTIIVGCRSGGRSARAAVVLEGLGFTALHDYIGGWGGSAVDPGWVAHGGPSSTALEPGRHYGDIKR